VIPIVVVIERLDDHDAAGAARVRRVEALRDRVDDLVVVAASGASVHDPLRAVREDRGPGVVVVDGGLALLERAAAAARASEHRVLWSLEGEPSAATAERAGVLADGALVASSAWFPRRVGMRSWVVRPRGGAAGDTSAAVSPWPPDPSAWADRVVQAAQIVAGARPLPLAGPAPISWRAPATDTAQAIVAVESLTAPSDPTAFDERRRGRIALLGAALLVVVLGLVVAATMGLSPSSDGETKRRDTAGVDTAPAETTDRPPASREDQPDGSRNGSNPDGGSDDTRRSTSTTRPGGGGTGTGSGRATASGTDPAPNPATNPGTSPATTPATVPATQPTTPPSTAPPVTTPPTTNPPPPTTSPPPTTNPTPTTKPSTPTPPGPPEGSPGRGPRP
jgi:hypothetical protein